MAKLTNEHLDSLTSAKGVKKIAVENFLCSLSSEDTAMGASINLGSDARAYGWNAATVAAIKKGIKLFFAK